MAKSSVSQMNKRGERLEVGKSHPVLASVSFLAAFMFAALPFVFNTDHVVIVSVCAIACSSAAILFLRLLIGKLGVLKYQFLMAAAILCICAYIAGQEWHLVLMITGGTISLSYFIARFIGDFTPLIHDVSV